MTSKDDLWLYATAVLYSLALAIANVAFPLLLLDVGYSATGLGLLVATSALAQIAGRWMLADVMRRVSNASIVVLSAALLAVSSGLLALNTSVVMAVVSALLQGFSRATFWTGTQTHIVRRDGGGAGAIAMLNLLASASMVVGPIIAGLVSDRSSAAALWITAAIAAVAIVPSLFLERPPPFDSTRSMSRRGFIGTPAVAIGLVANSIAGGWRGLLGSYVPVALERADRSSTMIGVLITVGNAAAIVGSLVSANVPPRLARLAVGLSIAATIAGTAFTGYGSLSVLILAVSLAIAGVGAGVLQVLGLTIAAEAVDVDNRGDAIAIAGTFRAAALFASPFGVAALLLVTPLGPAVVVMTAVLGAPALLLKWRSPSGDAAAVTSAPIAE